jgi:hypothetical protein
MDAIGKAKQKWESIIETQQCTFRFLVDMDLFVHGILEMSPQLPPCQVEAILDCDWLHS